MSFEKQMEMVKMQSQDIWLKQKQEEYKLYHQILTEAEKALQSQVRESITESQQSNTLALQLLIPFFELRPIRDFEDFMRRRKKSAIKQKRSHKLNKSRMF